MLDVGVSSYYLSNNLFNGNLMVNIFEIISAFLNDFVWIMIRFYTSFSLLDVSPVEFRTNTQDLNLLFNTSFPSINSNHSFLTLYFTVNGHQHHHICFYTMSLLRGEYKWMDVFFSDGFERMFSCLRYFMRTVSKLIFTFSNKKR